LDAAEEFALADEYHHQVGDGLEEGITWIEQWEDDVLGGNVHNMESVDTAQRALHK